VDQAMPEDVGGLPPGYWDAKRTLILNAAAVVAVSESTAADVARFTGLPRQSMRVIYHGVSHGVRWDPRCGRTNALPDSYLLVVGNRRAYKNFLGVAGALAEVLRSHPGLALVCFGGGPLTAEERAPFEQAGVARALCYMRGDDRALAAAYAHATAFIFPSLYEGFGMPILEAMSNRCPVVLPPRSSFPEIAADAALYFDHAQPGELVEILERLIGDATMRHRLGDVGEARARDFSWQRSVAAHADLYRSLA
jgi:glycosyltransferase involved in cell wall biosynthesis